MPAAFFVAVIVGSLMWFLPIANAEKENRVTHCWIISSDTLLNASLCVNLMNWTNANCQSTHINYTAMAIVSFYHFQ